MKATAKDLRFYSKELLETAARGEDVTITYRGKPCAKLVPYEEINKQGAGVIEENALFGMWKDNDNVENVDAYVRELRKGRF